MKIGHITSRNIELQQEVINNQRYIRQLINKNDSLSASLHSPHIGRFETPKRTVKPMTLQPNVISSQNRFDILYQEPIPRYKESTPKPSPKPSRRYKNPSVTPVKKQKSPTHPGAAKHEKMPLLSSRSEFPELPSRKSNNTQMQKHSTTNNQHDVSTINNQQGVIIIGDSMVRNSAQNLKTASPGNMDCTTYTHPGISIKRLTQRLPGHRRTGRQPGHVIIHVGTNSLDQEVPTTIIQMDELIHEARRNFPESKILISSIIWRGDNVDLNYKSYSINLFLAHKAKKTSWLDLIDNDNLTERFLGRDKLHMNNAGKSLFAKNIKQAIVQQCLSSTSMDLVNR